MNATRGAPARPSQWMPVVIGRHAMVGASSSTGSDKSPTGRQIEVTSVDRKAGQRGMSCVRHEIRFQQTIHHTSTHTHMFKCIIRELFRQFLRGK